MKVIKHLIQFQVEDGNYVYINTLNGAVDVVNPEDHETILGWQQNQQVIADSTPAQEVIGYMQQRGYIVQDQGEEDQVLAATFGRLKKKLREAQNNVSTIRLVLTYDCNFRCVYCYEDHMHTKGGEWLKKTMTKEMVDQIKEKFGQNLNWVTLFGGEPLLLENRELVEYCLEQFEGVEFGVTTNGYTLEEYLPLLEKYKFGLVEVTVDGPEEIHNQRRRLADGQGSFQKVLQGVEATVKAGLPVQLRMIIDESNIVACNRLFQTLVEKYQDYPNFKIFRNPIFGEKGGKNCRTNLLAKLFAEEDQLNPDRMRIAGGLDMYHSIANVFKGTEQWSPKYTFCSAHYGQYFFDPHGDVYTCWLALGQKAKVMGKYYPEIQLDPNSPWLNRTVENMGNCRECPRALLCGGGCANVAFEKSGNLMQNYCRDNLLVLKKLIPLLYRKYILNPKGGEKDYV